MSRTRLICLGPEESELLPVRQSSEEPVKDVDVYKDVKDVYIEFRRLMKRIPNVVQFPSGIFRVKSMVLVVETRSGIYAVPAQMTGALEYSVKSGDSININFRLDIT